MEMNKVNGNNILSEVEGSTPKRLNPAVLGVPSYHGAKLSLMTSEDKKEFLERLEEWRKARKEKLASKILAKQKSHEKSMSAVNCALPKVKSAFPPSGGISKTLNKKSVFERLYKANGKLNKSDVNESSSEITELQSTKKSILFTSDKPLKVLEISALPDENSKLSAFEFEGGENLNGFFHPSSETEISTAIENPEVASASALKMIPQDAKHEPSELKPLKSKSAVKKKEDFKNVPGEKGIPSRCAKIPLRRSISMLFRQKNKTQATIRRSLSAKNIQELEKVKESKLVSKSKTTSNSTSFVTAKTKRLLPSTHLMTKLENWLKVNGHPLEGYRHLRCFGIDSNVKVENSLENSHYSTARSSSPDESNKENMTPPRVLIQSDVTQLENCLKELRLLVVDLKYPSERCKEWLAAIRNKYPNCAQLPIYWDCLAASNESPIKGDMKSVVEDYNERAIIKRGEIDSAENSLAALFDGMVIEQKKLTKSKLEKGIDPKNIFKSTTIKFSLQHKTPKKMGPQREPNIQEQLFVATPVRRSTRVQTPFKSNEVASLETLTAEVKKNLTFKPNESLLDID